MPTGPKALRLVSHHLCPYAQRVAIALSEKAIAFERIVVDLSAKPAWFVALSPLGKVPLLVVGDEAGRETAIFESAVICEYLEDAFPGARLHPQDPLERARHRAWMEFASSVLGTIGGLYTAADEPAFEARRQELSRRMGQVEEALGAGPWFGGESFTLVDAAFAPVFRYLDAFDRMLPPLRLLEGLERVPRWREALAARASVRGAVDAGFPERLEAFLRARGSRLSALAS